MERCVEEPSHRDGYIVLKSILQWFSLVPQRCTMSKAVLFANLHPLTNWFLIRGLWQEKAISRSPAEPSQVALSLQSPQAKERGAYSPYIDMAIANPRITPLLGMQPIIIHGGEKW